MYARPHRGKDQLPIRSLRNLRFRWAFARGNGNRTKEIELMELGLTCSKFLKRSCEKELFSCFLKQELELIRYGNWY